MKISVSYLSSIFDKKKTIDMIDKSNADFIHVDLMDGKFVVKNNIVIEEVIEDLKNTTKSLDIHLMTYKPEEYIKKLSVLKPKVITFHVESDTNIKETLNLLKTLNIKSGIAINPNTNVSYLEPYLEDLDLILVMSVEPGAGGQRFIFDTLEKIETLNNWKVAKGYKYLISVDGGINEYTAIRAQKSGANIIVSGSYICHYENFNQRINKLKK